MSAFHIAQDGDILLTNGKITIEQDPFFAAAIKLRNRFLFFRGEWFLDTREGVPYFQLVFVKNPDLNVISRLFTDIILSLDPVIVSVTRMDLYFQSASRDLVIDFEALGADGRRLEGGTGKPFLIEGEQIFEATL